MRFYCATAYLLRKVRIDPESGCWIWTATVNQGGYGKCDWAGKKRRAHRFSYENFVGPIPDGMTIDHLCFTPACINPAHLAACSNEENMRRAGQHRRLKREQRLRAVAEAAGLVWAPR